MARNGPDHDGGYRHLFSHPRMIADLLRGFVHEPWVEGLDLATLERVEGRHLSDALERREEDIVWRARWGEEWVYVYLLLEFQSTVDRFMALRVAVYVGLLHQALLRAGELTRNGRLPPVLPVVLYNGEGRWAAPTTLEALVEPVPADLAAFQPAQRFLLLDENRLPEAETASGHNVAAALFQLERSRTPADVQRVLTRLVDWLGEEAQRPLRRSFAVWVKQVFLRHRLPGVSLPEVTELEEVQAMLSERVKEWTEEWKQQGIEAGRREGLEMGLQEGRQEGFQEGQQMGEAQVLLRQFELRFGREAADAHRERIQSADAETLLLWSERILTAESAEDVFG